MVKKITMWLMVINLSFYCLGCEQKKQPSRFQENIHFEPVQPLDQFGTPTITEFFWYGCKHCQSFAPELESWLTANKHITADYQPIIWNEKTELHAKAFYLLAKQSNFKELHRKMFDVALGFSRTSTIEEQKVELIKILNDWGIPPTDSVDALDGDLYSEEIAATLKQMKNYRISSVPTVIVDRQFKIKNKELKSTAEILQVADKLLTSRVNP